MMPNVTRGTRMGGLLTYLCGPGRHNEHTEPHLVAGDGAMMAWHDDAELGRDSALAIARHLDRPQKAFDVEVSGGHVWHCSLSIRAEEGQLTDQQWGAIADDFVSAMNFDDNEGAKAPCRWVAVRHGLSEKGNDHIHIAVNLVREDGTKASTHMDFKKAQTAARAIEVKHGLEQLESVQAERSTRGFHPAEREAQARSRARAKYERTRASDSSLTAWQYLPTDQRHNHVTAEMRADQPRHELALKVRAAATASHDEGEFVRRLRGSALLVRPRFADGRTDVVTGYSVAQRPTAGERPIWYGGGHLGRDLTLPRLRQAWPDSPDGAMAAVAEWNAAKRNRRVISAGAEREHPTSQQWDQTNTDLQRLVQQLRTVPLSDRDQWARVARHTAGAFAAWSNSVEEIPGHLAVASEMLSRSAQTHRREVVPVKATGTSALSQAAMLLASASRGGQGTVAQAIMLRQMMRLAQSLRDASQAANQARLAQQMSTDMAARLVRVRHMLPTPPPVEQSAMAMTGPSPEPVVDPKVQAVLDRLEAGRPGHSTAPIPNKIEARPAATTTPAADRGIER